MKPVARFSFYSPLNVIRKAFSPDPLCCAEMQIGVQTLPCVCMEKEGVEYTSNYKLIKKKTSH